MFRTALIATIGFFVVCSISNAGDPRVDAFVQGFNKGKQGGGGQGGQNDEAQKFKQILDS